MGMRKINKAMSNSKKLVLPKPFWSDWNTQREGQIAKTAFKATLHISSMKADHSNIAATRVLTLVHNPFTMDTARASTKMGLSFQ